MNNTLKQLLYDKYPIEIKKLHYISVKRYVLEFELRPTHIEALNTSMIGTSKMYFLPKDVNNLFNIFDIDMHAFKKIVHSASSVDPTRYVTSDIYNILIMWLCHRITLSSLTLKEKEDFQVTLFTMLHYKFFTSIINHNLPYGADEATMGYTINDLSGKFYIKQEKTPTWKLVIEARSKDIVKTGSIHNLTIKNFTPDDKILYIITDTQTRLKRQLLIIIGKFHENKKAGNKIITDSMVGEIDGEKVLKVISSSLDNVINKVSNSVLNLNEFIDHEFINLTVVITKNIKSEMLNNLLINFSEMATLQNKNGDNELIKGSGSSSIIYGYRALISNIVQKTYRLCMLDKTVNMKSKVNILEKTRTIYRSSRINDRDIIIIKNSVDALINKYSNSRRTSTNASLKIAFIVYIILLTFKEM